LGGGFGMSGAGFGGSPFGNQGFGMGGYGGGPAFVGRDAADIAALWTQSGPAGIQSYGQLNGNMIRQTRDSQPAPAAPNVPQPVRVELQVAFDAPRPAPQQVASNLQTRLGKILTDHNIAAPNVIMEGDTAVLTGTASSENERLVLEKLVALEPGVRQVRNELVVISPAPPLPPQDE
jgi:hypothetical protein